MRPPKVIRGGTGNKNFLLYGLMVLWPDAVYFRTKIYGRFTQLSALEDVRIRQVSLYLRNTYL